MMRTATDALDDFVAVVRKACAMTSDLVARAEVLRQHLRRLLTIPRWLEELLPLPAEGGFGRYDFLWMGSTVIPRRGCPLCVPYNGPANRTSPYTTMGLPGSCRGSIAAPLSSGSTAESILRGPSGRTAGGLQVAWTPRHPVERLQ